MDYAQLMEGSADSLPEEKLLPVGTWLLRLRNAKHMEPRSPEDAPQWLFFFQAREPMDDVDQDAVNELGPDYDFGENDLVHRIMINKGSDVRQVVDLLGLLGVDIEPGPGLGKKLEAGLKKAKGAEVLAKVTIRTYQRQDGSTAVENRPTAFSRRED